MFALVARNWGRIIAETEIKVKHKMKKIFGARLRELRGTRKQAETANLLGISVVRLSRLERGDYEPDLATIAVAAKKFHVTADWLLGLTDERNPPAAQVVTANANAPNATATATANDNAARILAEVARILAPAKAPEPPAPEAADLARRMDALENAVRTLAAAAARMK